MMSSKGKQSPVNHRWDNKEVAALLLPPEVPRRTQTDGERFKKALNQGLHDVSVHIIPSLHFFKDISLQHT